MSSGDEWRKNNLVLVGGDRGLVANITLTESVNVMFTPQNGVQEKSVCEVLLIRGSLLRYYVAQVLYEV